MVIAAGSWNVSAPIEINSSVTMAADTKIKATQTMSAVFQVGSNASANDITLSGGIIECNNLTDGIWLRQYQRTLLTGITVRNSLRYGFRIGDPTRAGGSDAIGKSLYTIRDNTIQFQPDSISLFIDTNALNSNFNEAHFVGTDIGVRVKSGGNFFSGIHAWAHPDTGMMTIAFDDQGNGNFWSSDIADSGLLGLSALKYNTMVSLGRFLNNSIYSDPDAIGIQFEIAQPYATVSTCVFQGSGPDHTMATDVAGATPVAEPSKVLRWLGNVTVDVMNSH